MPKLNLRALQALTTSSGPIKFRPLVATPVTEPRDLSGIIKDLRWSTSLLKSIKEKLLGEGHQTGGKTYSPNAINLATSRSDNGEMIDDCNNAADVYDEASAQRIGTASDRPNTRLCRDFELHD
jgi:hypothetical protein